MGARGKLMEILGAKGEYNQINGGQKRNDPMILEVCKFYKKMLLKEQINF